MKPSKKENIKQAIREVLLSEEFLDAFAIDLIKWLAKAKIRENIKAKQIHSEPKWTPKIGDWVQIKKPTNAETSAFSWFDGMDKYNGQVIQVKQIEDDGIVHDEWGFLLDWLEPAEQPLNSDKTPEGYRRLND